MRLRYRNPVYPGYFADPFVVRTDSGYLAIGTGSVVDGKVFEVLRSSDLVRWERVGGALEPLPAELGSDYWAPELAHHDGSWWMYYSVGVEDRGHQLRVARAQAPEGPYRDCGVELTSHELFAIDPSPFQDADGTWYLFYAHDVLDGDRVGTMIAVDVLETMTRLRATPRTILRPSGDWQVFLREREMYGEVHDWHTLEGPSVRAHGGRYYCFFSFGAWTDATYGVSYAVADAPNGRWVEPPETPPLLRTVPGRVIGPGHTSVVEGPHGGDLMVYHAWDPALQARRMCIDPIAWTPQGPRVAGPTWETVEIEAGTATTITTGDGHRGHP